MSYRDIGDGIASMITGLLITCAIAIPLALWKVFELGVWIWHRVHFGVNP